MPLIDVIAASAGTGKTYRLAEELKRELLDASRPVAPERVVAVTFTRAAAAELAARVRRSLLESGHTLLARRLAAARIGTLHSVCARLVRDHAFELGLSPELQTLDEHLAAHAIRTAVEQQVGEEARVALDDLHERLGGFAWQDAVRAIIDSARLNNVDADGLALSARRSAADLVSVLPPAEPDDVGKAMEQELLDLIDKILVGQPPKVDDVREEWAVLQEMRRALRRGDPVPWHRWLALGESHYVVLHRFGAAHLRHPRLRDDLARAVDAVFGVASHALRRYEEDKRAWGVFDFVDQETFALRLLQNAAVRPLLREQIGLVLVDEFQDTSPLQLAILSEMSALAERTVFVGDQKQAIFGFRGADPQLMDAVIPQLATTTPAPLDVSWRSRPGLVALTSSLFAPAFARQGIPEERVRVRAVLDDDPPGLGSFIERWRMSDGRSADEIAAGVAELLEDQSVRVRDASGQPSGASVVGVRPKHVAVLARTNRHARDLAVALDKVGIPAVLRRRGLASSVEARALMAGLALFVDGKDALAAAELARVTRGAADPNQWLSELVSSVKGHAFVNDSYVSAVAAAAQAHRNAGVIFAVDLVVEALRLRDACAAWGDAAQRLANLGALRALAVRFSEERAAVGGGATIVGFIARLQQLAATDDRDDDRDDEQGDVSGQDAVEICTWHKAKGREWPIVVLAQLVYERPPSAFGVHVESDAERGRGVDVAKVLEGRWVRFWPNPYGEFPSSPTAEERGLHAALAQTSTKREIDAAAVREQLRLLYVGWTRARDRLVLAGPVIEPGKEKLEMFAGPRTILRHLVAADGKPLLSEPGAPVANASESGEPGGAAAARAPATVERARWAGHDVDVLIRNPRKRQERAADQGTRAVIARRPHREHPPASLPPSSMKETGESGVAIPLGAPLLLRRFADEETMARLGTAVHGFFAADPRHDDNERYRLADFLLGSHEVADLLSPGDIVEIADRLWRALDARHPGARVHREAPVVHRLPAGTVVRGQMDLVLELAPGGGFVIIDHKTYVTDEPVVLAATFAGQLRAYSRALVAATTRPVVETLVHLPLSGALVPVR